MIFPRGTAASSRARLRRHPFALTRPRRKLSCFQVPFRVEVPNGLAVIHGLALHNYGIAIDGLLQRFAVAPSSQKVRHVQASTPTANTAIATTGGTP